MNIYLDIDGVLLVQNSRAADYADEFLQFVLKHWPDSTYWLSSYCRRGENIASDLLEPYVRRKTHKLLSQIKPTEWDDLKTDAINFKQPFLWYDTELYSEETAILEHYEALPCFRRIDLQKDQFQLLDELVHLRSLI